MLTVSEDFAHGFDVFKPHSIGAVIVYANSQLFCCYGLRLRSPRKISECKYMVLIVL